MVDSRLKISLTLFILFISVLPISETASGTNEVELEEAVGEIHYAFGLVVEAYEAGGDVEQLVTELNEALGLLSEAREADLEQARILAGQAYEIAEWVEGEAPKVRDEGVRLRLAERNTWILVLVVVILGGFLTYFLGPRLYWLFWLRMRRNYIVRVNEKKGPVEGGSLIFSGEVWAVVVAVIVLVSIFAYTEVWYARNVIEPFSEFGILGPDMTIGDYPSNITVGETIHLNIYVANHMGKPTHYVVKVKLRDKEADLDPAPGSANATFEHILLYREERITPFNMTIEKLGLNQRLIFELWLYNATSNQVEYHDRWGWIWLNVTKT